MRRGRGQVGACGAGAWAALWIALVVAAGAPGARGFVYRPVQDSVEAQVAYADLIIRGRVGPAPGFLDRAPIVEIAGPQVIGGDWRAGETVRLALDMRNVASLTTGTDVVLFLRKVGRETIDREGGGGGGGGVLDATIAWYPVGIYALEGPRPAALDPSDGSPEKPAGHIYRMDGRRVSDAGELLELIQESARLVREGGGGRPQMVQLQSSGFPTDSPLHAVRYGVLRVPADRRLEAMARAWLEEADVRYRARAAEVLAYFPSPENRRRLHALLKDPGYELGGASSWEPARGRRVIRLYGAREAAAWALRALDDSAGSAGVEITTPQDAYRPVRWGAVFVAIVSALTIAATSGRREGAWRRAFVWGAVAVAAWVLAVGLRSRWPAQSIAWSDGEANYELVASGGRLSLIRVADGSLAAPLAVRSEQVLDADGRPWFAAMLNASNAVGAVSAHFERGVISQPSYAYQMVTAPLWLFAAVAALVPAWAAGAWVLRRARRRRRIRRGLCGACGYDLRGSAASPRCPECGAVGRARRVARTLVAAALLMLILPAGRAGAVGPVIVQRPPWPTLEMQVGSSTTVVRGRVVRWVPRDGRFCARAEVEVLETIKGPPGRGRVAFYVLDDSTPEATAIGREWLVCLKAGETNWRIYALDDDDAAHPQYTIAMDGRPVQGRQVLLEAVRREAARGTGDTFGSRFVDLPLAPFDAWRVTSGYTMFRVPADERLEAMARRWTDDPDPRRRELGARALEPFVSLPNRARLERMLRDPAFTISRQPRWEPSPDWRDYRWYFVRAAAEWTLSRWERSRGGPLTQPPFVGPDPAYRRPPWGRWGAVGAVVVGGVLACGRRGVGWRRPIVGTSALAALWAASLMWSSDRTCATFDASDGRGSMVLASARGALWWVRVEDASPRRGVTWHGEDLRRGEPPWFSGLTSTTATRGCGGFAVWAGKEMSASGRIYGYRVFRVPYGTVVVLLAAAPLWAIAELGWGRIRRRRRMRARRCGSCGYDLRGLDDWRPCPECGIVTTPSPPPAAST